MVMNKRRRMEMEKSLAMVSFRERERERGDGGWDMGVWVLVESLVGIYGHCGCGQVKVHGC